MQTHACVMSIGSPSRFKTYISNIATYNQLPPVYKTVTPLCRIESNREFSEPLHPRLGQLPNQGRLCLSEGGTLYKTKRLREAGHRGPTIMYSI